MIQVGDDIRLRIVGTRVDASDIVSMLVAAKIILFSFFFFQFAVGTLMDDFLGKYIIYTCN